MSVTDGGHVPAYRRRPAAEPPSVTQLRREERPPDQSRSFQPRAAESACPQARIGDAALTARLLHADIERFLTRWPRPNEMADPLPAIDWGQLERQFADLATLPGRREMAGALVAGIRKRAQAKPAEMVIREILCLAGWMLEEA
jgi:hypothetical protein